MKIKFIVLWALLGLCSLANGQVAKWIVRPDFKLIYKEKYAEVLKAESFDGSSTVWSMTGKELINTKDYLAPFHEGLAVVTVYKGNTPTSAIKGVYTDEGKYIPIKGEFTLLNDAQMFNSGHLLVKDRQKDNLFRYLSPDGSVGDDMFVEARPFQNGFASCETYEKWDKRKGRHFLLLDKDLTPVELTYSGKTFDKGDVNFISSVNDEGIGIVVAKEKVFYFSAKSGALTPLYMKEQEENMKNQALVDEALLTTDSKGTPILRCHTRKTNDEVIVSFDEFLKPMSVKSRHGNREFEKRKQPEWNPTTSLSLTTIQGLYGILYRDSLEVLPPQFKKVTCYNDNAIVLMQNGKYGVLQVLGDKDFILTFGDGEPIPFKHKRTKTTLHLDMPVEISPDNVRLLVKPECGCTIDELTKEKRSTEAGNRIQYQAFLSFPDSLPDKMGHDENNKLSYPGQIQYHGLISPMLQVRAYAWHYKYFVLEPSEEQVSNNGIATFKIKVSIPSDEQNYPFYVDIASSDSLETQIKSFNVFTYECTVSPLKEGINNFEIIVKEDGCPPITIPYQLTYAKPVRRREQGKVSIIQKTEPKQEKFIPKI